jgi:phenylacetate-coenzyme A ligase PaaK-like adenylate-forming protein
MLRRLRCVLRRADERVPFYTELFKRIGFDARSDFGFADFARIPILEREEVREAGDRLLDSTIPKSRLRRDATGGSSGTPTEIWLGPQELGWRESGIEHFMRRIALPRGSRTGLLWVHNLDPLARDGFRERVQDWINNSHWFDCVRISPTLLDEYHDELMSWRPACIIAYAGVAALLAERAAARGDGTPSYPTRCFVTGAEKLHRHERELIERTFQRPVHERYGSRDVGLIGFQLDPARSLALSIDWANVLVEPEHDDAVASVIITKLNADGMPMIRYRIGDVARFPAGSTPGSPAFTVDEVTGRETDRLWMPDGRSVHGVGFPHLMKDFPVADFQVLQRPDYSVTIYAVPRGELTAEQRASIVGVVQANLPGLPVRIELVGAIAKTQANKRRPVVSEVAHHTSGERT